MSLALLPRSVTDYEVDEPTAEEQSVFDPETPMISLHAIAGIRTKDTIQLYISIDNEQFVTILDSGSLNNFIRGDVEHRMGL